MIDDIQPCVLAIRQRMIWLTIAALTLPGSPCFSQQQPYDQDVTATVELGGWAAASSVTPFWLRANQYGLVPNQAPGATLRAGVWKAYARPDTLPRKRKRLDWGYGIHAVGNAGTTNQVLLDEAYGKIAIGQVELWGGRRRHLTGLGDSTLSSGFLIGSDNALPLPKIQLATRGFIPIGFLKWLSVSAGYAHGWFNVPYLQGSYLHQKHLYFQFGKAASRLKVYAGINHQVQWGGQADFLIGTPYAVNGKMPSQIKYYPNVVLGIRPKDYQNADYTNFDGAYWLGNGLGSTDFGAKLTTQSGTWLLYHQHPYEDLSGLLFINFPDGLTGLSWVRRATGGGSGRGLQHVVVEYLSTLNQSGSTFNVPNSRYEGADNYFNHGQYREGWSYLGRSLGSPFIAPGRELQPGRQEGLFFPNNRVQMGYVAASGQLSRGLHWTTRVAYSRNYGTFSQPYAQTAGQFSGLLSVQVPVARWPGTFLSASAAVDRGDLLPGTSGGFVSLTKRW